MKIDKIMKDYNPTLPSAILYLWALPRTKTHHNIDISSPVAEHKQEVVPLTQLECPFPSW